MVPMRRSVLLLPTVLAVGALGLLAGCGSGGDGRTITLDATGGAGSTPTAPSPPAVPQRPKAYQVPRGVPQRSDGGGTDAVSRRVIRKWLGALSDGDIPRAGRFFALPSKVQNGTPVLTLRSP
ncbi:MAG: hypothetical protein JWM31_250, partial [Solirubrobacterales bacterium]|nr:hypothetical protein [Solirubrobacterales bacterium]